MGWIQPATQCKLASVELILGGKTSYAICCMPATCRGLWGPSAAQLMQQHAHTQPSISLYRQLWYAMFGVQQLGREALPPNPDFAQLLLGIKKPGCSAMTRQHNCQTSDPFVQKMLPISAISYAQLHQFSWLGKQYLATFISSTIIEALTIKRTEQKTSLLQQKLTNEKWQT